jgi:hypothetical protein
VRGTFPKPEAEEMCGELKEYLLRNRGEDEAEETRALRTVFWSKTQVM